ncbi:hypothetical protein AMATHDRAFT_45443 [Amanita thiersii Skay4041]|uniref:Uncharacterized protein n=1 Tax=Amanita thiersii Skay4041 TaxID=703135 RepID=A0A2A9NSR3_9AGAR|nr:hypothetical protein AMATHDRAFT_45443 [Amanita thiersii Skay4041]
MVILYSTEYTQPLINFYGIDPMLVRSKVLIKRLLRSRAKEFRLMTNQLFFTPFPPKTSEFTTISGFYVSPIALLSPSINKFTSAMGCQSMFAPDSDIQSAS